MAASSRSLQATALTYLVLSIGHTGSAWLLISGILHYQWSKDPAVLQDPLTKAIAGISSAILWASSVWYAKTGVKDNAVLVGLSAVLQTYSVFSQ
ncbi:hypothetical protein POX_c04333 [Penicillium oxalicum]|uniref:hypothetical protein n=1 Tax=Penicillium oxalicum TaxID=69781 RepID=UPI0020B8DB71|nr:hypothetical protein POX_c04333 [Penicillium oxalicum]KAI2791472.1 hypothetical protein POX_c04333 [Penicillium oxalicum]